MEAYIVINGVPLNEAQSSTVRVAVASWLMELAEPKEMELLGPIGPIYQKRLVEIQKLIFLSIK